MKYCFPRAPISRVFYLYCVFRLHLPALWICHRIILYGGWNDERRHGAFSPYFENQICGRQRNSLVSCFDLCEKTSSGTFAKPLMGVRKIETTGRACIYSSQLVLAAFGSEFITVQSFLWTFYLKMVYTLLILAADFFRPNLHDWRWKTQEEVG